MSKITECKNEEALDLLADIIEPCANIFSDKEVKDAFGKYKDNKLMIAKEVIKKHKKDIIEVLATLQGVKVSEYKANVLDMTKQLLDILNDKELSDFFMLQAQTMEE